jgi:hypothetical protein
MIRQLKKRLQIKIVMMLIVMDKKLKMVILGMEKKLQKLI